jgi:putative endonuclease
MHRKYRRMLKGMKANASADAPADPSEAWSLYILECGDGSYYTGIALDVEERVRKHNAGKGAAYTRSHRPVRLVYREACADRSSALIRECQVKSLPRPLKRKLIVGKEGS